MFANNFGLAKPTEPGQNLAKLVLAITRRAAPALNLSKARFCAPLSLTWGRRTGFEPADKPAEASLFLDSVFRSRDFRFIEEENQDNPYLPSSTDVR